MQGREEDEQAKDNSRTRAEEGWRSRVLLLAFPFFSPADLGGMTAPNKPKRKCGLAPAEPPDNRAGCARGWRR